MARTKNTPAAEVTTTDNTAAPESTMSQSAPETTTEKPAVDLAFLDNLTPEQLALAAIKAKQVAPDMVKAVGKLARRATRLAKRAAKKDAKCDPTSDKYDPAYAARVKVREANKLLAPSEPGAPRRTIAADKVAAFTELIAKAGGSIKPERIRKAGVKPLHNDAGSITGYRATVRIMNAEGDEAVSRKTLTLAKTPDLSLDAMKADAEQYVLTVLKAAV
jgi:hypothetical protein